MLFKRAECCSSEQRVGILGYTGGEVRAWAEGWRGWFVFFRHKRFRTGIYATRAENSQICGAGPDHVFVTTFFLYFCKLGYFGFSPYKTRNTGRSAPKSMTSTLGLESPVRLLSDTKAGQGAKAPKGVHVKGSNASKLGAGIPKVLKQLTPFQLGKALNVGLRDPEWFRLARLVHVDDGGFEYAEFPNLSISLVSVHELLNAHVGICTMEQIEDVIDLSDGRFTLSNGRLNVSNTTGHFNSLALLSRTENEAPRAHCATNTHLYREEVPPEDLFHSERLCTFASCAFSAKSPHSVQKSTFSAKSPHLGG